MRYDILGFIAWLCFTLALNLLLYDRFYKYFSQNLPDMLEIHYSKKKNVTSATPRMTPTLSTRSTSLTSSTSPLSKGRCSDYVIFSNGFQDGRGLGNQIFNFAVGIYVSELTGRRLAINDSSVTGSVGKTTLEEVFQLDHLERFTAVCPILNVGDELNLGYSENIETIFRNDNQEIINKTINLSGFFQSWKYTRMEKHLRKLLKFKDELELFAGNFLENNVPLFWKSGLFTRVGIHIRRGDVLNSDKVEFGYTTPDVPFFRKAMQYMVDKYRQVQFIVASDNYDWSKNNIKPELIEKGNKQMIVNVTFSKGNSAGQDLAILAHCDHTIMSTGTYGWWGAWLAHGTTIYYSNWPRNGSELNKRFRKYDFFPPSWIGMDIG